MRQDKKKKLLAYLQKVQSDGAKVLSNMTEAIELVQNLPAEPVTPAPAPVPSLPPLVVAPQLVNPKVWKPTASDRILRNLGPDQDVIIDWGVTYINSMLGIEINGGRNIVSVGGRLEPQAKTTAPQLKINGASTVRRPRTVHVEGLHIAGPNVWEGINIDSKAEGSTLTVQFKDILIDEVHTDLGTTLGSHIGGDALQTWNGPHRLLIDGFTAKKLHYQGFMLQPWKFGGAALGTWEFRNILLEGDTSGCAYLLWLDGERSKLDLKVSNFKVVCAPGDTAAKTLWRSASWPEVQCVLTA